MTPLDIHRVRRELPEKRIEYYLTVDSTMNVAARLAAGAVVVAEEQTAGQGRHGTRGTPSRARGSTARWCWRPRRR